MTHYASQLHGTSGHTTLVIAVSAAIVLALILFIVQLARSPKVHQTH